MKNPLIRLLLLLNAVALLGWGGFLAYKTWRKRGEEQTFEKKVVGITERRGLMSREDAEFLHEARRQTIRSGAFTDAQVERILTLLNGGVSAPDERFFSNRSTRTVFCLGSLMEAKRYTRVQQARLAEALPPFPSLRDHPDPTLRAELIMVAFMAKHFDDPVAKARLDAAVAAAREGDPNPRSSRPPEPGGHP